jgi:hypothetical protein
MAVALRAAVAVSFLHFREALAGFSRYYILIQLAASTVTLPGHAAKD